MTRFSEIVKIDDRGRIVIPGYARKMLNLKVGSKILMIVDDKTNRIILTPFLGEDSKPIRARIRLQDEPMSLARVAMAIGKLGINLILGEAHTIHKGIYAEWSIVADISTMKEEKSLEEIAQIMREAGALEVEWYEFE
ncbi:MAG: AbrB/MazE/SpoVT family DNA-binding domain-containing protein [Promethearchaeota archaeon]